MSKTLQKKIGRGFNFTIEQIIIAGISALVLGVFIGAMVAEGSASKKRGYVSEDIFSTHALEIAGEFRCSCGTCGEKNLAICTCETALIEKRYIENSLKASKSHQQIVEEMTKIYVFHNKGRYN